MCTFQIFYTRNSFRSKEGPQLFTNILYYLPKLTQISFNSHFRLPRFGPIFYLSWYCLLVVSHARTEVQKPSWLWSMYFMTCPSFWQLLDTCHYGRLLRLVGTMFYFGHKEAFRCLCWSYEWSLRCWLMYLWVLYTYLVKQAYGPRKQLYRKPVMTPCPSCKILDITTYINFRWICRRTQLLTTSPPPLCLIAQSMCYPSGAHTISILSRTSLITPKSLS